MAEKIIMPKQGLQMTEGTITAWLVAEGSEIKEGMPLFEMETDKLTITMDSTATGTILKIIEPEGATVHITETIAVVGTPGEDISDFLGSGSSMEAVAESTAESKMEAETEAKNVTAPPSGDVVAAQNTDGRTFISPRAKTYAEKKKFDYSGVEGTGPDNLIIETDVMIAESMKPKASPLAKRLAGKEGIELQEIVGTGIGGKIMSADFYSIRGAALQNAGISRGEKVIPVSGMRKVIAKRMKGSLNVSAQTTTHMTVDMTETVRLRQQLKGAGIKVSYNDIIIRCTAMALSEFTMVNAVFDDGGIIIKEFVNVGMAVAVEGGLLVPVIKDADLLTLPEISAASADLAKRTKENNLSPDEVTGGTFTVSNLGMFDVDQFVAIINQPESGILAVGMMSKRPVVIDDEIIIRQMMELTLSYDHRIIDGATSAQFLRRIKQLLENPGLMI